MTATHLWAVAAVLGLIALGLWLLLRFDGGQSSPQAPAVRASHDESGRPILWVLFVGNSLTQGNDLPGMVSALSRGLPDGPVIQTGTVLAGGADLGDNWQMARGRIAEGGWDFVVLQQGPSSLPESRAALLGNARTYAPAIRAAGAQPAFYMVWPAESRSADFERACESYRLAAGEVDALLLPAGEAWRIAWRADASLPLYGGDRFHPSRVGSYLAALVICGGLSGVSPLSLPGPEEVGIAGPEGPLVEAQVTVLKRAAAEALEQPLQDVP